MDELASAAKVATVIAVGDGVHGEAKHTLDSVAVDASNAVESVAEHTVNVPRAKVRSRRNKAGNPQGGSN